MQITATGQGTIAERGAPVTRADPTAGQGNGPRLELAGQGNGPRLELAGQGNGPRLELAGQGNGPRLEPAGATGGQGAATATARAGQGNGPRLEPAARPCHHCSLTLALLNPAIPAAWPNNSRPGRTRHGSSWPAIGAATACPPIAAAQWTRRVTARPSRRQLGHNGPRATLHIIPSVRLTRTRRAIRYRLVRMVRTQGVYTMHMTEWTFAHARDEIRAVGCTITRRPDTNEWRVNFSGGTEATAYYAGSLADAVDTARAMARAPRDTGSAAATALAQLGHAMRATASDRPTGADYLRLVELVQAALAQARIGA